MNAAYHSATLGAPASTPPSMKSKSMMRLSAATVTTKRLNRMPMVEASWISGSRPAGLS